jgi:hypothetical protein
MKTVFSPIFLNPREESEPAIMISPVAAWDKLFRDEDGKGCTDFSRCIPCHLQWSGFASVHRQEPVTGMSLDVPNEKV